MSSFEATGKDDVKTVKFSPGADHRPPSSINNWIQFDEKYFKPSREAIGVWIQNGSAWKIYKDENLTQFNKMKKALSIVGAKKLPLVRLQGIPESGDPLPTTGLIKYPNDNQPMKLGLLFEQNT